jgi:hypothetical protein
VLTEFSGSRKIIGTPTTLVAGGSIFFSGGINGAWLCYRANVSNTGVVGCGKAAAPETGTIQDSLPSELSSDPFVNDQTHARLSNISSQEDNFYDGYTISFVSGPGVGQTRSITSYAGNTRAVTWVGDLTATLISGKLQSGSDSTARYAKLAVTASEEDDAYNGAHISFTSGPGSGQSKQIIDYVGNSRLADIGHIDSFSPVGNGDTMYSIISSSVGSSTSYHISSNSLTISGDRNSGNHCTARRFDWDRNPISLVWTDTTLVKLSWIHCAGETDAGSTSSRSDNQILSIFSSSRKVMANPLQLNVLGEIKFAGGKNGAWLCFRAHSSDTNPVSCGDKVPPSGTQPTIALGQNDSNICTKAKKQLGG